jgi:hypothetical protein
VLPNSQVPRKLKLNIDSASELHQWLILKELQCGVRDHESAQMFVDNKKELRMLAEAIRNKDPNAENRVELMSVGEVLGTALITWLKNEEDEIEVARRGVKAVWPLLSTKRSQTHSEWAASCNLPWVSARYVHCMQRHRKLNTVSMVCRAYPPYPANAKRTPAFRTKQLSWDTVSQSQIETLAWSPCPRHGVHALGEQWIEEVTDVDTVWTTPEECLEGEHLKFKAHIRGWKTVTRERRCQSLLVKTDHNLWRALLSTTWKDVLLVPQPWYPEHTLKYETEGWWYVPAEAVLGRTCKSCNASCELKDFTGKKRQKTVPAICYKCKFEEDWPDTQSGRGKTKTAPRKRTVLTPDGSTLRRSERVQGQERVDYHGCLESEIRSDSEDDGSDEQLFYGLKMRAADPRYITHGYDCNRGDILRTLAQVRELIIRKQQSEEGVATVWLTTAEMGFSLTDDEILCPKDVREGKVIDRYLAPAISRFVTNTLAKAGVGVEMDQQAKDVWRELVNLHQLWGKISKITEGDNIRTQACNNANVSGLHKNRPKHESPLGKRFYCESSV